MVVSNDGGKCSQWRNVEVSSGIGAHAWGPADLPAQRSLGKVGVVMTPVALLGPARVLLEWEKDAPLWRSPSAALSGCGSLGNTINNPYASTSMCHTSYGSIKLTTSACGPRITLTLTVPLIPRCNTKQSWHHVSWLRPGWDIAAMS